MNYIVYNWHDDEVMALFKNRDDAELFRQSWNYTNQDKMGKCYLKVKNK